MKLLQTLNQEIKLVSASPELISEVQRQLIKIHLLRPGGADGVAGPETLKAFGKFKLAEHLEHIEVLGPTTAQALLDASEMHPPIVDPPSRSTRIQARFPEVGLVAAGELVPGSQHFTWDELTKGLSRVPESTAVVRRLIRLAKHLDEVRGFLGDRAITITSGYRPPAVNRAVGGVSNSQHVYGAAADIVVGGIPPHEVFRRLDSWHGSTGGLGDSSGFTHIDLRGYRARWNYGNA